MNNKGEKEPVTVFTSSFGVPMKLQCVSTSYGVPIYRIQIGEDGSGDGQAVMALNLERLDDLMDELSIIREEMMRARNGT